MKVSVLLINYNQERFLRDTLDSVLAQDHPDFEVVIADDCSTDGSRGILTEYSRKYPEKIILAFRERNGGITQNAITAFQQSRGDLIAYLDGDDLYLPGKLRRQSALFADPNVVLSYHDAEVFDSDTGRIIHRTTQRPGRAIANVADIITKMGLQHTSSMMVRRTACPPYGFDSRIPHASDWLFEIEVAMKGQIARLDGIFSRYRRHANSASAKVRTFENEFFDILDIVEEKYSGQPGIRDACRLGRARFVAGQAFRRFPENRQESRRLLRQARSLAPTDVRYQLAHMATYLPIGSAAVQLKYLLKRYVG